MTSTKIQLSIVVCTYNRSALLELCLLSLGRQEKAAVDTEVIIVDNNSTDDTPHVTKSLCDRYQFMSCCVEPEQGLQRARNRGFDIASGRYIAYLDDDAIIPENYISAVTSTLSQEKPDIMGGPVYPYYNSRKPRWFRDEYEIRCFAEKTGFSKTCRVSGSNFVIKKSVLEKLGKFDIRLGIVGKKLGMGGERAVVEAYRKQYPEALHKIYYDLEAYVFHLAPAYKLKLFYQFKRMFLSGRSMARIHGFGYDYLCQKISEVQGRKKASNYSKPQLGDSKHVSLVDILHAISIRIGLLYGIVCNLISPAQKISAMNRK